MEISRNILSDEKTASDVKRDEGKTFFDKLRRILMGPDKDDKVKDMALTNLFNDMSCFDVKTSDVYEDEIRKVYSNAFLCKKHRQKMELMVDYYLSCFAQKADSNVSSFNIATKALNSYFDICKYIFHVNACDNQNVDRKLYYNFATAAIRLGGSRKKIIFDSMSCRGVKGIRYVPIAKASYAFDAILYIEKNSRYFLKWINESEISNKKYLKNMYGYLFECKGYRKVKRYHMVLDDDNVRKNYIIHADNNRHVIQCMDCADKTSVETIRPMRLVEKICDSINNNSADYHFAIVGNLDYDNVFRDKLYSNEFLEMIYLLELMLRDREFGGQIYIDWYLKDANLKPKDDKNAEPIIINKDRIKTRIIAKSRKNIANMLENAEELEELVKRNDALFLLDCYELYDSLDFEKRRDSLYGIEYFDNIKVKYSECFETSEYTQTLQNKTHLERLMTQLNGVEINPYASSGKIRRIFKKAVLDFLRRVIEEQSGDKKIYVYFDNGKIISEADYPEWQIIRRETYNDKLIQIAQIPYQNKRQHLEYNAADHDLYFDMHKMIKNYCLEYYYYIVQDILLLRNDLKSLIERKSEYSNVERAVALIANIFQSVSVHINYAKIHHVSVDYSIDYDKLEKNSDVLWSIIPNCGDYDCYSKFHEMMKIIISETTEQFLDWAFKVRKSDDYMLNVSYRNNFKTVLNNASVSVNDMLFTEIYSDLDFEITAKVSENSIDSNSKEKNTMEFAIDRVAYSYAFKQISLLSMSTETNIRVLCDNYQLDYKHMLWKIIKACQQLELIDTQLYQNAAKLFND